MMEKKESKDVPLPFQPFLENLKKWKETGGLKNAPTLNWQYTARPAKDA